MSAELTKWTKEDLQQHKILDDLLIKNVSWSLSTSEAIQLYRSLVWFAQLKKKIEDSQAEIVSVKDMQEPEHEKAKKRTKQMKTEAGE